MLCFNTKILIVSVVMYDGHIHGPLVIFVKVNFLICLNTK